MVLPVDDSTELKAVLAELLDPPTRAALRASLGSAGGAVPALARETVAVLRDDVAGRLALPSSTRAQLRRLFLRHHAAERLGRPRTAGRDELRAAAVRSARRWQQLSASRGLGQRDRSATRLAAASVALLLRNDLGDGG
jgi:hypothetical protein